MELFFWIVGLIILIVIFIIWCCGCVLSYRDGIKEKEQKKIEENEKYQKEKLLEIEKKKRNAEIQRNSSIDLSTLAFPMEFKEEFGQDFFEFKKSLN